MARLGGFGAAPMQPERSARTTTANGIASVVSLVPKMTDGDLGITTAWANQAPPDTVYVTETRWRCIPSKSSPSRWLADLGVVLRWGAALIALAILLVMAFDYKSAHDGPSEQSAMTFNLSF
jgi:hypothetical protein